MKKYLILFLSIVVSYTTQASNPLDELPSGPLSLNLQQVERLYGSLFQHAPQQEIEVKTELLATVFGQPINPEELKETEFNKLLERSSQWVENTQHIPLDTNFAAIDTQASDFAIVIPKGDSLTRYKEQLETLVAQLENPLLICNIDSLVYEDGVLNLMSHDLTNAYFRLRLSNPKGHATQIGDSFLYDCNNLTSFDTQGLQNVTQIGDRFLGSCLRLTSFDTRGLQNVTQIGYDFLADCDNLTRFDTRALQNVTQIRDRFLFHCSSLTSFDTQGLQNLTLVGNGFLANCENLTSLNTRGLQIVTQIDGGFLCDCPSLTSVDTRGLQNVTQIGYRFLADCVNLTSFDPQGLQIVTQIGNRFLDGCDELNANADQLKLATLERGQANRLTVARFLTVLRFFIVVEK